MSRGLKRFFVFTLYPSKIPKLPASSDLDLFMLSQTEVTIHLETKFIIIIKKIIINLIWRIKLNNIRICINIIIFIIINIIINKFDKKIYYH
jgi:Na+-transporting NADH:ubiquinone oxidoreductase subunit NqrD